MLKSGRSSLAKLRSVVNPSRSSLQTLTFTSPPKMQQFHSHFLSNPPLYRNPRFFSQVSEDRGLSSDTFGGFGESPGFDNSEDSGHQHAGILWSNEKEEAGFDAIFGLDDSEKSSVGVDNSEDSVGQNVGIVWSNEKEQAGFDAFYGLSNSEKSSVAFDNPESADIGVSDETNEVETEIDIEKLESVLSLLQSSVDESLGSRLEEMDLALHEVFVMRILETPLVPGESLLGFFNWALKRPGFPVTAQMLDRLVEAISQGLSEKDTYGLWDMLKEIGEGESGVLNSELLNKLIALFSKLRKGKDAFEVYNKFEEFGCVPNVDTYLFTLEALSRRSLFDSAWSVCEKMLEVGIFPHGEQAGQIISWLCKANKPKEAHVVYLFAKENKQNILQRTINFLISSLSRSDDLVSVAVEMLEDFPSEARKYAIKPFSSVIRGLCRIKNVEGAKELVSKMILSGPLPGNAVFNAVISGLSKAGDMEEAVAMMRVMESKGLKPDVYTYTVIMSGYTRGGQMEDACKLLSEAKEKHTKLNPVTYHTLIRGFCKLEDFDSALKLLDEMKSNGMQPNADEYGKLIQSLCLKALDWKTAEKLLEEMKGIGLHLNGITRGLIRAVQELEEEEPEAEQLSIQA